MIRVLFIAVLLSLAPLSATANEADYRTCMEAAADDAGQTACGQAWIDTETKVLEDYWAKLMAVSKGELEAEQQAWLAFRSVACQTYSDKAAFDPESGIGTYPSCVARVVSDRAEQLREHLRHFDP